MAMISLQNLSKIIIAHTGINYNHNHKNNEVFSAVMYGAVLEVTGQGETRDKKCLNEDSRSIENSF